MRRAKDQHKRLDFLRDQPATGGSDVVAIIKANDEQAADRAADAQRTPDDQIAQLAARWGARVTVRR
jgi:hypothetical protein